MCWAGSPDKAAVRLALRWQQPGSNLAAMPLAGDGRSGPDSTVDRPSLTLQQPPARVYGSEGRASTTESD
jgi:hypothetical protein